MKNVSKTYIHDINTIPRLPIWSFQQFDDGVIRLELTNGESVVDLFGQSFTFFVKKSDGAVIEMSDQDRFEASRSSIDIHLTTNMLDVVGRAICELQIGDSTGEMTVAPFQINIRDTFGDDDPSIAESYSGTLDALVKSTTEKIDELEHDVDEAKNTVDDLIDASASIVEAEALRVQAENIRSLAESFRSSNESDRDFGEAVRTSSETNRVNNEQTRVNAETLRVDAETIRASNEQTRVNVEALRANAEPIRATAEESRVNAEVDRVEAEESRVNAETNRANAEADRVEAEADRVNAEADRVEAEESRGIRLDEHIENHDKYTYPKLVVEYTHTANKELHFTAVDWETSTLTCSEPHGITNETRLIIVPNDWSISRSSYNHLAIPIEYVGRPGRLTVEIVDDMTIQILTEPGGSPLRVDPAKRDNGRIDVTKFHMEAPVPWVFENLPLLKYCEIRSQGYIDANCYRYAEPRVVLNDGRVQGLKYLFLLNAPVPVYTGSRPYNAIYGSCSTTVDMRNELRYIVNNVHFARRTGYAHVVWDGKEEKITQIRESEHIHSKGIVVYKTMNEGTAHFSNGTNVQIYDLGGH